MKQYIHQLLGVPLSCCHYINCSKWGSVSRARNFFTISDTKVIPPTSPSPFDNGWSPSLSASTQQPIPLPPWLRPRHTTLRGSVVQTPLAYHPKHLLYDISYFGTFQQFLASCQANVPLLYPKLPFTDFLPEFLWSDWQALVDWSADFNSELTQAILDTVSRLQDFYSNPHIYLPFRLPNLREKAKDSELSDLIDATIAEADPPLRTLHNIIGNFFKPSAVLAALGGPNSMLHHPLQPPSLRYSRGAWRSLLMNSCHRLPPHTWSKEASLSRKVSSSHPFVLLFIHPCSHGVNSGASLLPLSHLPFIKSLLKPFLLPDRPRPL